MSQETPDVQQFQSETNSVQVTRESGCRVKLEIQVAPKTVKSAHKKAIKAVSKEVSLPGFRKGHAPEALILKNYAGNVDREWRQMVLEMGFQDALKLVKIYPLDRDGIKADVVTITTPDEAASLVISYEAEPSIPDVDCAAIELKSPETKEISDKEMNEVLDQIRFYHAEWTIVEDRPAQENDHVRVDIVSLKDDQEPAPLVTNERIAINENLQPWLKSLIVGKNVGDISEGESFLTDTSDEATRSSFVPGKYRVTINTIENPVLPEVDQAFAEKIGAKDVEDLMTQIRGKIDRENNVARRQELRELVETHLIDNYAFDLPKTLLENETKFRFQKKQETNKAKQQEEKSAEDLKQEAETESRQTLHLFYLCRKIANKYKISVTNQELYSQLARMLNIPAEQLPELIKARPDIPQELSAAVYSKTLIDKVKDYVVDHAKIA
ncbi:MAG: trigger factor [Parachlamydiales bacterium]|nr:trigger factor [Parachlamydiales bacterium]